MSNRVDLNDRGSLGAHVRHPGTPDARRLKRRGASAVLVSIVVLGAVLATAALPALPVEAAEGPPVVELTASSRTVLATESTTYTVQVVPAPDLAVPTGEVNLYDEGAVVPGCDDMALDAEGRASCTTTYQLDDAGDHTIVASYDGDGLYQPATSAGLTMTVFQHRASFGHTGSASSWTVPTGVERAHLALFGAAGGTVCGTCPAGGLGGAARLELPVTAGQVYEVHVGGQGGSGDAAGGFNGGGGGSTTGGWSVSGGSGGGATDVRLGGSGLADRILVAGGGGGSGGLYGGPGGDGGGSTGGSGGGSGTPGTQVGPGTGASLGQGAAGADGGAGGGGGYYGGGRGDPDGGAAGGGSGFGPSGAELVSGERPGHGLAEIYFNGTVSTSTSVALDDGPFSVPTDLVGLTVTVESAPGGLPIGVTTGTITVLDGGVPLAGCAGLAVADDGTAPCSTQLTQLGSHTITAAFSGDAVFEPSAATPVAAQVHRYRQVFDSPGSAEVFTVTGGLDEIAVVAYGAAGGPGCSVGGLGALAYGTVAVSYLDELRVRVGGAGANPQAGINDGGDGDTWVSVVSSCYRTGGGGGASDVRLGGDALTDRVVVGGGGGGGGNAAGGAGGFDGTAGENSSKDYSSSSSSVKGFGGGGGTQSAGGAGGAAGGGNGSLGEGGDAPHVAGVGASGGGGGGGLHGGGSGGYAMVGGGGGGGGSSSGPAGSTFATGVQSGDGRVELLYTGEPVLTASVEATQVYGATATYTVTFDGFVDGDDESVLGGAVTCTSATPTSSGGPQPLSGCGGLTSPDYAIEYVPGTLTVTPAPLTATVTGTWPPGDPAPVYTPDFDGLRNGEGPGVIGGQLACSTDATESSPVDGTFAIFDCSGLTSADYDITYAYGTLIRLPEWIVEFGHTGAPATWIVPPSALDVAVDLRGALGGWSSSGSDDPGLPGRARATVTPSPGTAWQINVGGKGSIGTGGFNGGGDSRLFSQGLIGGGGGGATDLRIGGTSLAERRLVAGGGGGAGGATYGRGGGDGGGIEGADGRAHWWSPESYGRGGTQLAGGAGGTSWADGQPGVAGDGGDALLGGGGGGGWYGGGGGGSYEPVNWTSGGGGGGSGYGPPGAVLDTGTAGAPPAGTGFDGYGRLTFRATHAAGLAATVTGTQVYGEEPTYSVTYEGLLAGDDATAVTGTVSCSTDATATSAVGGGYTATGCSGLSSTDYALFYVDGGLAVTPAPAVPTVTGPLGDDGWYVGDATVSWSVTDPASTTCADTVVDVDIADQTVECTVTAGGQSVSASVSVSRDATPPEVSVAGIVDGGRYLLGTAPLATCVTTDATSGVRTPAAPSYEVDAPPSALVGEGRHTITCAGAVDVAGVASADRVASWDVFEPTYDRPAVAAGAAHTCAVDDLGQLSCWGNDAEGQASSPTGPFLAVSAGGDHTCALAPDETLACFGGDVDGQASPPAGTFVDLSAGASHTCAVARDGSVACWGDDGYGKATAPSGTFSAVAAGSDHTCALAGDGPIECWGRSSDGQTTPPAGTFRSVTAGQWHSCGLRPDGTIECWGRNSLGQASAPAGTFTQVAAGDLHTCGVRSDGSVSCWGSNWFGQATPPIGTFAQVSAGGSHTCAVASDGTRTCWGDDSAGQLGATNQPPSISSIADQSTVQDSAAGPIEFYVEDDGHLSSALTVTASSDDQTLLPDANLVLAGTGLSRSITVTPAAGETGTATVTLTVADPDGLSASTSFEVTVAVPSGTITGTARTTGGTSVDGVLVGAYAETDGFAPTAFATAAADGTYSLGGLPDGDYRVVFVPPSTTGFHIAWHGPAPDRTTATVVTITAAGTVAGIDGTLATAASISGTVTDPDATPLAGVTVQAFKDTDTWIASGTTTTAADGTYTIGGLPPGTYRIRFAPPAASGLRAEWHDDTANRALAVGYTVAAAATTTGVNAQLALAAAIVGTATNTGSPLSDVTVQAFLPGAFLPSGTATTGPDGTYTMVGLPVGTYHVRFTPPGGSGLTTQWYDGVATRSAGTDIVVADATLTTGIDAAWP